MTEIRRWTIENDPDFASFASFGSTEGFFADRFNGDYRDPDVVSSLARRVDLSVAARRTVATVLASFHRVRDGDAMTMANIAALEDPDTLVIATGQQPGLFGGPLYSIYKAITAIVLARKWARALDRRVIPVFWIASDDHDAHEVESATIVTQTFELSRYRADLGAFGPPIADLVTSSAHLDLARRFASDCVGDLVEPEATWMPRIGEPWSDWFARILSTLTRGTGLVLAEPHSLRDAIRPHLEEEIRQPERSQQAILRGAEALRNAGAAESFDGAATSCLFVTLDGRRQRYDPHRHRPSDLDRARESSRSGLSGDAALRTIVQSRILPVLAVVGGPGEYRYWSQLRELFDAHGTIMPLFVPRIRATLLWPAVRKHIDALSLPESEWLLPEPEALASLRSLDSPTSTPWLERKSEIRAAFERLASALEPLGGSVPSRIEQARAGLEQSLTRLLEVAASRQREAAGASAKRRRAVSVALRPGGKPQERVLTGLAFALRFGFDFFPRLAESLDTEELRASYLELRY